MTLLRDRCRKLYFLAFFCFITGIFATSANCFGAPLPTLRTAHAAHSLTSQESMRGYPVHLKAVVTYYDPYIDTRHPAMFVHDATGSIFVVVAPSATYYRAGMLLDLDGVTAPGEFAPIVVASRAKVIKNSHVPRHARDVTLDSLLSAQYDACWVAVEGIVKSIHYLGQDVNLELAMNGGSVTATTVSEGNFDYSRLIDAKIRMHANEAPLFNRNRQMTGVRLFFPGLDQITVEEAAVVDPFATQAIPIDRLLKYDPNLSAGHRVHVRGRVTLQWPGRMLCIEESAHGLCVETAQTTSLGKGEMVDLVGFPSIGGITPTLTDTTFRTAGVAQAVSPSLVNAAQALHGEQDAKLVRIEGKLIGFDRATKDPTLVLSSGNFLFPVVLPEGWNNATALWQEGSVLQVTGICSVMIDKSQNIREGFAVPVYFRVLLRSPLDIVVLRKPSWWNAAHLLPVLASMLAITLFILGWIVVLRHRITGQSAVIREQNAILSELSFQDGLTGIANRRRFDEASKTEFEKALLTTNPISLLMVDIDHFKALNDEYGHQCGDECLARVAQALVSASVRKGDLVSRYGGEEFAVILPDCDEQGAIAIAERMRTAVLNLGIKNTRSPFNGSVSISIGVAATRPSGDADIASLIAIADAALYQSKLLGRNRTTSSQFSRLTLRSA